MDAPVTDPQLCLLFHQLNNQLGIVLAHAELLEAKASDVTHRARAEQVVEECARRDGDGQRNQAPF